MYIGLNFKQCKLRQMMFKNFNKICDVVSLVVYCPSDKSILLSKEVNGEYWIPSGKTENNIWKITAKKLIMEVKCLDSKLLTEYYVELN